MCGEDTGSGPRHNITIPPCLLRITGLGGQKQLNDSMAKVMGNHGGKALGRTALPTLLRTAAPDRWFFQDTGPGNTTCKDTEPNTV